MLEALLWALIYTAVICFVGYVALWFLKKVPGIPSFVPVGVQLLVAIIVLVVWFKLLVGAGSAGPLFH